MTDPKRWSEGGDASELERELLVAGQSARLPETERRALWAGIALSLPAVPPATTPTTLGGGSSLSAYLTKGAIFLVTLGGLTFGALQLAPRAGQVAKPATTLARNVPAKVSTAAESPEPAAIAAAPAADAPAPPVAPPSEAKQRVATASQLREESVAVLEARAALRAGDPTSSLALLEQARVRFARGALGQEREALTIEALAKSGQAAAARRRAEAFLRAHPQSPYVADVRRIAAQ